jgi:hypothetical protein
MGFSKKMMGKEVGDASVYAKPHTMSGKVNGKVSTGEIPEAPYNITKAAKDVGLTDPVPNGVSFGMARIKTEGVVTRGNGAATKGLKARGPMA